MGKKFIYVGTTDVIRDRPAYLDAVRGNYIECNNIAVSISGGRVENAKYYIIEEDHKPQHYNCEIFRDLVLQSLFFLGGEAEDDIPHLDTPVIHLFKDDPLEVKDLGTLKDMRESTIKPCGGLNVRWYNDIRGSYPVYVVNSTEKRLTVDVKTMMDELTRNRIDATTQFNKV